MLPYSEKAVDSIDEFYSDRHVFFTGATGMLGMACLPRLILDTSVSCIYAVVRGGESRLWKHWAEYLPEEMVVQMRKSDKLIVWEGDITLPKCGLGDEQLALMRENVSIFIHGASTINLTKPLAQVSKHIIWPSMAVSEMALSCPNLVRFVYISTAYSSAFLTPNTNGSFDRSDAVIPEAIVPIRSGTAAVAGASAELSDLEKFGTTPEYEFARHPFPYTYAKHLTERLILDQWIGAGLEDKLMIFRPSCICPAEVKPYPFYELPGSCPGTTVMAALIASPPIKMRFSSHLQDPSKAMLDEVPVDVVVNRLISHVAYASSGCVHAVAGATNRRNAQSMFHEVMPFRRFWWGRPSLIWCDEYWKSDKLCAMAKMFSIFGCSWDFTELKTVKVWEGMSDLERQNWPLWSHGRISSREAISGRAKSIGLVFGHILSRLYGLPSSLTWLFFNPKG